MAECPFCSGEVDEDLITFGGPCPKCFGHIPGEEAATDPGEEVKAALDAQLKRKTALRAMIPVILLTPIVMCAGLGAIYLQFLRPAPELALLDFDELDDVEHYYVPEIIAVDGAVVSIGGGGGDGSAAPSGGAVATRGGGGASGSGPATAGSGRSGGQATSGGPAASGGQGTAGSGPSGGQATSGRQATAATGGGSAGSTGSAGDSRVAVAASPGAAGSGGGVGGSTSGAAPAGTTSGGITEGGARPRFGQVPSDLGTGGASARDLGGTADEVAVAGDGLRSRSGAPGLGGPASLETSTGGSQQSGLNFGLDMTASRRAATLEDPTEIRDMIGERMSAQLRSLNQCYERELKVNESLSGRWRIKYTVQRDGTVANAAAVGLNMRSPEFESCMVQLIERWRFGRIKADQPVQRTLSFTQR